MKKATYTLLLVALAGLALMSAPAHAAVTSDAAGTKVNLPFSLGYRFTVTENLDLTALGQFDVAGDGFNAAAKVALFNWDTGAKLVETTLAGAVLEETGFYDTHFVSVPTLTLTVGVNYLVAVEVAASDFVYGNGIMTFDSSVDWIEGRATPVGSPAMPATASGSTFSIARANEPDGSYFGPNMKFDPGVDEVPPSLDASDIVDDQNGGPVGVNTLITYTVTFSEDIDHTTVDAADFGNAGTAPVTIGVITEASPGVFSVGVTPTAAGTLRLQVPAAASILDPAGNALDTQVAIIDDTTIDVVVAPPGSSVITITSPTTRHIVQRSADNTGDLPIAGGYTSVPTEIQARAVVMAGRGNSGSSTAWQTIDASPGSGSFAGTLTGVPAGGWYQIEVRGVVGGAPGTAAVLQKAGVGDIYVTAGQSNSANYGSGGYTASDDRVCARTAVTGMTWILAADPIPIAGGGGGCAWTRLGDLLAAAEDVPIGFIALGVGSTQVSQWIPGTSNYNNRLKPTVQSFPTNGFRAVLWHQGESDSLASVSATTHASRLGSMISQSRVDAGWDVPWYLAEVSFHPGSTLSLEEPVAAGQRLVVHGDPLVFLGPSTDEFHLEDAAGGKLNDSVHFNNAGLLDHARQWRDILRATTTMTPRNGNFEDNRTPSISNLSPLADGASHIVSTSNGDSPSVLGWRILSVSGSSAADGSNGFHNPTTGTFSGAVDTVNGGILPNMDGKHVAVLDGGAADNFFLHSTRALAQPNRVHTLTVALGVRDDPAAFGGARVELTANGVVVASASFDKAALDTLRGGDSAGTFTDVSVQWITGGTATPNQPLAIRVIKEGGTGTVLDFDNVRLSSSPNDFNSWISDPSFGLDPADQDFGDDPDGDRLANGLEAWLGTHPGQFDAGFAVISSDETTVTFTHPQNESPPSDVNGVYEWSSNLINWFESGAGPVGGPVVTLVPTSAGNTTTVTATASAVMTRLFLRARVSQN